MPASDVLAAQIAAQLRRRRPIDERDARSTRECIAALATLPAPFDRSADPTHITGSGVVVGARGVLLLLHRRLGIWVQPGGHLEPGETPWEAARRETAEETGLDVRLADTSCVPGLLHVDVHRAGPHTHLDLRYLLTVEGDDDPRPPPGESQDVRWMAWPEAIKTADEGLAGLLRAMVAGGSVADGSVAGGSVAGGSVAGGSGPPAIEGGRLEDR